MKPLINLNTSLFFTVVILGLFGCKKEEETPLNSPAKTKPEIFVIGSESFYDNFTQVTDVNSKYSDDSTFVSHYIQLGDFNNITIYELRNYNALFGFPDFGYGTTIEIEAFNIVSELRERNLLFTQNAAGDSTMTSCSNSLLTPHSDTIGLMEDWISVPKFFNQGDTISVKNSKEGKSSECILYRYRRLGSYGANNIYHNEEEKHLDILSSKPQFLVVKFSDYGKDQHFGVLELSLSSDTTLMIHNIYYNQSSE